MERIIRLVVHVETAIEYSDRPDIASQRLALLLFDSAAELLLHREGAALLAENARVRRELTSLEAFTPQSPSPDQVRYLAERRAELEAQVLSKTRTRKVEREFDAKATLLADEGLLPKAVAKVLSKLHEYRNEAYHRDMVRPGSLIAAVRIYRYIVLTMLRDLPAHVISYSTGAKVAPLRKYFKVDPSPFEVQLVVANELLARTGGTPGVDVVHALSDHLLDRLAALDEVLELTAFEMAALSGDDGWDAEAVLHYVQLEGSRAILANSESARAEAVTVDQDMLSKLVPVATALRNETDALVAFGKFAAIEDGFGQFEQLVEDLARRVDNEVDSRFDAERER